MIENKEKSQLDIKSVLNIFDEKLSQEAKNVLNTLSNQEKRVNYRELYIERDAGLKFDFRDYKSLKEIFRDIYNNNFSIEGENVKM